MIRASALSLIVLALALSGCASAVDPKPTPTQAVGPLSQADAIEMMNSCLEEAGWEISDRSTGEVIVPPEQMPVFEEDSQACTDAISLEMGWNEEPLTEEELSRLYELEVEAADCLRGMGYTLEVPTLQAFIDTYRTEPFIAHVAIGQLSQPEWERATQECPPAAWTFQR
jgi:hypothetical protein